MKKALLPAFFGLSLSVIHAANWPCFRGPDGCAGSEDTNVPLTWSATENMKWKLDLPGAGTSSPIVWEDRVFITCFSGQKDDGDVSGLVRHVICVNKKTGAKLWQKDFPATQPEDPWSGNLRQHGYTSQTPVTDGRSVFVDFGKGGVVALDFEGKVLWQAATGSESNRMRWGSAGSPVLWKNLLIINASDEARSLMAFDTATGKTIWKQEAAPLEMDFSSPRMMARADGQVDLLFSAPGELWGLNPSNGKLRWFVSTGLNGNVSPDPVVIGDTVCVAGGFPTTGMVAVRAGTVGEGSASDVLWRAENATYVPTPLLYEGCLYVVNDQGLALCVDAKTGATLYNERLKLSSSPRGRSKPIYASPIRVADKIYAVTRRMGTVVLAAKPQFAVLAANHIDGDDTDFNAAPAVSDGCLLLRSNQALYCIAK